ncbi:MAG: NHLP leader peptide family RiPP precursor [Planctomycetaceae bacterium]|jgi:hypothetical protein|nr:NHLP leader peptide family RiPP precursor [Planctomycetaceae bacterium]
MANWTKDEIEQLRQSLAAKAAFDAAFRKALLENPSKIIEEQSGKKIPEGFSIDVIENKPGVIATFVLPNFYGDKLGKNELAAIAGGRGGTDPGTNVTVESQVAAMQTSVTVTTADVASEVSAVAGVIVVAGAVLI